MCKQRIFGFGILRHYLKIPFSPIVSQISRKFRCTVCLEALACAYFIFPFVFRATLDIKLKHILLDKKTEHDIHCRKLREKDKDLKYVLITCIVHFYAA